MNGTQTAQSTDTLLTQNYARIKALLNGRPIKNIAGNTWATEDGLGSIGITLHATRIVLARPDGSLVLNSGGYRTVTTKERLNRYLPPRWYISQDKGVWYLVHDHKDRWVFADNMEIWHDGTVLRAAPVSQAKEQAKLAKAINKYAAEYARKLAAGEIPAPSGGDCWYCLMFDKPSAAAPASQASGDPSPARPSPGHLLSHMGLGDGGADEVYYVPSLLVRAREYKGGLMSAFAGNAVAGLWYGAPGHRADVLSSPATKSILVRQVTSVLRSYLRMRLGLSS